MVWQDRAKQLVDSGMTYREASHAIEQEFGVVVSDDSVRYHAVRKHKESPAELMSGQGMEKVLVLSDIHAPFHREEEIIDIVKKHRDEISAILIVGDLVDCEPISIFPNTNKRRLIHEMIITYRFLKRLDRLTHNIPKYLIYGNHEVRFKRYLADQANQLLELHGDNILEQIVDGFTYYDREKKRKYIYPALSTNFQIVDKWFYQYHDLVVAHPKNFSKIALRTATNAVEFFIKRGLIFTACFIGHTHKWGNTVHYGKWCGELGCLCNPMPYADDGNINYSPQEYGYLLATFVDGEIDVNQSQHYRLAFKDGDEEWQELLVDVDQE